MYCVLLPVWVLGAAGLRQLLEATMESFGGNITGKLKLSSGSDYGLQHFFARSAEDEIQLESTVGKSSRNPGVQTHHRARLKAPSGVRPEAAKSGGIHEPRSPH